MVKKLGCKKNSGNFFSIPPSRFPQQLCLQIRIFFTRALSFVTDSKFRLDIPAYFIDLNLYQGSSDSKTPYCFPNVLLRTGGFSGFWEFGRSPKSAAGAPILNHYGVIRQ